MHTYLRKMAGRLISVNTKNQLTGKTPLDIANEAKQFAVVQALLHAGAKRGKDMQSCVVM